MKNKYLIVTGASSGIGESTAELFKTNGYTVYSLSRRPCPVSGVISKECDLANPDILREALSSIASEILDHSEICIVHNAGIFTPDRIQKPNHQFQEDCFKLMVRAPSIINEVISPKMGAKSSIIYIGSNLSFRGVENSLTYTIFKHSIVGLMRATCQDTLNTSIHTACICPGFVDTPMHRKADEEMGVTEFNAKRLIKPEEVAEMALFIAKNSAINGSVIEFNTGYKQF